jgi:hypothetical protein
MQMDPVINMMFKAVSNRLKELNDKINSISETVIRDLACRIFFDGLLHPVPSSTVLKAIIGLNPTEIDNQAEAYWVNTTQRQNATYFFTPIKTRMLYPHEAVVAIAKTGEGTEVLWANPQWKGKDRFLTGFNSSSVMSSIDDRDILYLGLRPNGNDKEIAASDLFVQGSPELLGHLRWARWRFTESGGAFGGIRNPGKERLEKLERDRNKPEISIWGYGYFAHEHQEEYRDYFYEYPSGQAGPVPEQLKRSLSGQSDGFWDGLEPLYWMAIEFDKRIPLKTLRTFEFAATNSLVAINTHFQKQSFFYHGPGTMTLELQTPAGELFEITSIEDNRGRQYQNIYNFVKSGDTDCRYIPRIDGNILRLLISPPPKGPAPDRLTIQLRTSNGASANGISQGLINALYSPYPGIESIFNLIETKGGVNAGTFEDMIAAFPKVLRSRNRAIVAADFESLALSFDGRIKAASAKLGSTSKYGIMSRCIELGIDLGNFRFVPEEEARLFLSRLERFLESRSPMGTIVVAKIL